MATVMTWANRRRLIIVSILLAFLVIFVVIPYEIITYTPPSCFDTKQNQNETGVDCGGVCSLQCKGTTKDLNILWTKIFPIRSGVYYLVSYLENPNIEFTADKISYTVRLYGEQNLILAERKGTTYALPNERFAVFEGGLETGDQKPVRGEIIFDTDINWYRKAIEKQDFSVVDKQFSDLEKRPRLSALLLNNTQKTVRDIDVTAVVYDAKGNPIGASATKVERIEQSSAAKLFFTWGKPFDYQPGYESCEKPVDVMLVLDRSGSMASDGKNPPQPLTQAIQAAAKFVDRLTSSDQAGYVSFATDATNPVEETLSNNFDRIKKSILRTKILQNGTQYTNIGDALSRAREEFDSQRHITDSREVIVLLTDGIPTYPKDPNNPKYASEYALSLAQTLKREGANIYTIGLGQDVDNQFLKDVATTPEYNYTAASGAELGGIYQQIASAICQKGPSVIEIIPRVHTTE